MKIIVSAGGTGGHIYPALAIINKIKERNPKVEILYIGTTDRMESVIVPKMGINYVGIEIMGLDRRNIFKNFKVISSFNKAVKKVKEIIKDFNPDVVLGIGGYVTAPVVYAAHSMKIKTFIHEQNSIPGLSNKILNRYADVIGVSLPSSLKYFNAKKAIFTGNPRSEEALKEVPMEKGKYGLSDNKKLVLIVMGSLGSMTVSAKMKEILPKFIGKKYEVLFVTGKNYYQDYKNIKLPDNVKAVEYINEMLRVMKKTDLIVTRAGASTIAEVTTLGIPAIFVPSPYVTHNHQEKNALVLVQKNAAKMIRENELSAQKLINEIDTILNDSEKMMTMKKNSLSLAVHDSATKICKIVEDLAKGVRK